MEQLPCKYCGFPTLVNYNFCPNCGKKLKEPPITLGRQIGIYALSIFLPPLGLYPGIKLLLQKDDKARVTGFIAIALTIVSTVVTLMLTLNLFNSLLGQLGQSTSATNQLNTLQNLGY